jgi:hypothetical protein
MDRFTYAIDGDVAPSRPLAVQVVATTDEGTRCALAEASQLTDGLNGRIIVLVPHQVSYAVPLDDPNEAPEVITEQYRSLASAVGIEATVRLCLCRRHDDVFRWLLFRRSPIVIGGRRRKWWPTAAERVARRLIAEGHDVIFADVGAEERSHGL